MIKKIVIVLMTVVVLFISAAVIIPIIYKDRILKSVDAYIAKNINADVIYHADEFSFSLFKNFPNLTVNSGELGVFNRAPFEGKHLFVTENIGIEINLKDLLFGEQIRISGISLVQPSINIIFLKDGRANFDITYPSPDTVTSETSSSFSFAIDRWSVIEGQLEYSDESLLFAMSMKNIEHSGSGDFNEKIFDLATSTTVDSLVVNFDGTEWISNKKADINAVISISDQYSRYAFKDNTVRLNDFAFGFDGWFLMGENEYQMDIGFQTKENSFKSLLSLVPGMYTQDFESIDASGTVAFDGKVKGVFSETKMPAFSLALSAKDGMFQYPSLPESVKNILLDLVVENADGIIENTRIDLKKLHAEFGKNPVDASLKIENLKDYSMEGKLMAKLDLGNLTKLFPLEGYKLAGMFSLNADAKGIYDSVRQLIPVLHADMRLDQASVVSSEPPVTLDKITAIASVKNNSGKLSETIIDLSQFSFAIDGEPFIGSLLLQNPDDFNWKFKIRGGLDLGKVMKMFPAEGLSVVGKMKADIESSGKYSDATTGRYDRLPTSGNAQLTEFNFISSDLSFPVSITKADMTFSPRAIELQNVDSKVGVSDFKAKGSLSNYIGYFFGSKEILKGDLTVTSNLIDLNEFMIETEEEATADTVTYGVLPVPENISFHTTLTATKVLFQDFVLSNAKGEVNISDRIASLKGVSFGLLGGQFGINGSYDTRNLNAPRYAMDFQVRDLSIKEAASFFSLVKKFAPIAGQTTGSTSADFRIAGLLTDQMTPELATVNASGMLAISNAGIRGSKALTAVTALTKLRDTDQVMLKDVKASFAISDGKLSVKPFDIRLGNFVTTVSGTSGLDGALDYRLKMMVPASAIGSSLSGFVPGLTGATGDVPLNISLGGTVSDPKPTLLTGEAKQMVQEAVVTKAKEEGKALVKEALKSSGTVSKLLGTDSTRRDSASTVKPVEKILEDKLRGLLKKKKKN